MAEIEGFRGFMYIEGRTGRRGKTSGSCLLEGCGLWFECGIISLLISIRWNIFEHCFAKRWRSSWFIIQQIKGYCLIH